jgi:hypothetical protein
MEASGQKEINQQRTKEGSKRYNFRGVSRSRVGVGSLSQQITKRLVTLRTFTNHNQTIYTYFGLFITKHLCSNYSLSEGNALLCVVLIILGGREPAR